MGFSPFGKSSPASHGLVDKNPKWRYGEDNREDPGNEVSTPHWHGVCDVLWREGSVFGPSEIDGIGFNIEERSLLLSCQ